MPFVVNAGYAATYRNWHWTNVIRSGGDKGGIKLSGVTDHYPSKSQLIGDEPEHDRGGNYGRFARTGLMDAYMERLFGQALAGVPLDAWQRFLAIFTETTSTDAIHRELSRIAKAASGRQREPVQQRVEEIRTRIVQIAALLEDVYAG